jgi:hypothetical protein
MHLLAYVFSLKKYSITNRQNTYERLFTELVSAYLSSEGITRRPMKTVLTLVHVSGWVLAYYFSLTNSVVTDPPFLSWNVWWGWKIYCEKVRHVGFVYVFLLISSRSTHQAAFCLHDTCTASNTSRHINSRIYYTHQNTHKIHLPMLLRHCRMIHVDDVMYVLVMNTLPIF